MSSTSTRISFPCPSCHHAHEFIGWDLIDVSSDPDLKEKVLDGTAFEFICPECGMHTGVLYSCTYEDADHKLLVFLEEKTGKTDHDVKGKEDWEVRIVHHPNELSEKILLREEGKDDRIVELMKLALKARLISEVQDLDVEELLYAPDDQNGVFAVLTRDGFSGTVPFEPETYQNTEAQYQKRLRQMKHNYEINEAWALSFIHQNQS